MANLGAKPWMGLPLGRWGMSESWPWVLEPWNLLPEAVFNYSICRVVSGFVTEISSSNGTSDSSAGFRALRGSGYEPNILGALVFPACCE